MPDPAGPAPTERRRPATASNVHDALVALDAMVRQLEDATPEDVGAVLPELEHRVEAARELSEVFLRALKGWADPITQDAIRSLNQEIASGKPLATVPVDQVIAELRRRLAGNNA